MKRFIIAVAALLTCAAAVSYAQPKAIGGRLGAGVEASYQHSLAAGNNGFANFIQLDAGLALPLGAGDSIGAVATCTYNFVFAKPKWTTKGEWEWHAGPGAALGYNNGFVIGVTGQVGLMYTFDFGLQLGASFRPTFGLRVNDQVGYWGSGTYAGLVPTISVRYAFR